MSTCTLETSEISKLNLERVFSDSNGIYLCSIWTADGENRKGYGTLVLNKTIEFCKEKGYHNLYLIPANDYSPDTPTKEELVKWYKSFGFENSIYGMLVKNL